MSLIGVPCKFSAMIFSIFVKYLLHCRYDIYHTAFCSFVLFNIFFLFLFLLLISTFTLSLIANLVQSLSFSWDTSIKLKHSFRVIY